MNFPGLSCFLDVLHLNPGNPPTCYLLRKKFRWKNATPTFHSFRFLRVKILKAAKAHNKGFMKAVPMILLRWRGLCGCQVARAALQRRPCVFCALNDLVLLLDRSGQAARQNDADDLKTSQSRVSNFRRETVFRQRTTS